MRCPNGVPSQKKCARGHRIRSQSHREAGTHASDQVGVNAAPTSPMASCWIGGRDRSAGGNAAALATVAVADCLRHKRTIDVQSGVSLHGQSPNCAAPRRCAAATG
jgi:hypothetical protein